MALLAAMRDGRVNVGAVDQAFVDGRIVGAHALDQFELA